MHSLRYRCKTGDGTMSGENAECIMQNVKSRVIARVGDGDHTVPCPIY